MEEFVIGQRYDRPCVRAAWWSAVEIEWVPIIGPRHEDQEFIGVKPQHFHVDYRFVPKRQRDGDEEGPAVYRPSVPTIFRRPVNVVSPLWPTAPSSIDIDELGRYPDLPVSSWYQVRRFTYTGPYPAYPFDRPQWLHGLYEAYRRRRLKPGMVCPHRGADLTGMVLDEEGCVTCPLHGLRWNATTGKIARPEGVIVPKEAQT